MAINYLPLSVVVVLKSSEVIIYIYFRITNEHIHNGGIIRKLSPDTCSLVFLALNFVPDCLPDHYLEVMASI